MTHGDFWITVGTVAPLIAIAHAVALGKGTRAVRRVFDQQQADMDQSAERVNEIARALRAVDVDDSAQRRLEGPVLREAAQQQVRDVFGEIQSISNRLNAVQVPIKLARASDIVTAASWASCTGALSVALFSLAWDRDLTPVIWGVALTLIPAVTLVATALIDLFTGPVFEKLETESK